MTHADSESLNAGGDRFDFRRSEFNSDKAATSKASGLIWSSARSSKDTSAGETKPQIAFALGTKSRARRQADAALSQNLLGKGVAVGYAIDCEEGVESRPRNGKGHARQFAESA